MFFDFQGRDAVVRLISACGKTTAVSLKNGHNVWLGFLFNVETPR
jgi:hypothetical protein